MKKIANKLNLLEEGHCFICGEEYRNRYPYSLQRHHIFDGARRPASEKYGLKIFLCDKHHNVLKDGVHNNQKLMDFIQQFGQRKFQEHYPDLSFTEIFGKNYL